MTPFHIRILAAACGLLGTLLLLFGNRAVQKGLSTAARVHEKNLEQEVTGIPVRFVGATKHVARGEALGRKLRVAGIVIVLLAAALSVYSLCVERPVTRIAGPERAGNPTQPVPPGTGSMPPSAGSRR